MASRTLSRQKLNYFSINFENKLRWTYKSVIKDLTRLLFQQFVRAHFWWKKKQENATETKYDSQRWQFSMIFFCQNIFIKKFFEKHFSLVPVHCRTCFSWHRTKRGVFHNFVSLNGRYYFLSIVWIPSTFFKSTQSLSFPEKKLTWLETISSPFEPRSSHIHVTRRLTDPAEFCSLACMTFENEIFHFTINFMVQLKPKLFDVSSKVDDACLPLNMYLSASCFRRERKTFYNSARNSSAAISY